MPLHFPHTNSRSAFFSYDITPHQSEYVSPVTNIQVAGFIDVGLEIPAVLTFYTGRGVSFGASYFDSQEMRWVGYINDETWRPPEDWEYDHETREFRVVEVNPQTGVAKELSFDMSGFLRESIPHTFGRR